MTLLDKAKSAANTARASESNDEEIELALAWARGQISYGQAQSAITNGRKTGMSAYPRLAIALRTHIRRIEKITLK